MRPAAARGWRRGQWLGVGPDSSRNGDHEIHLVPSDPSHVAWRMGRRAVPPRSQLVGLACFDLQPLQQQAAPLAPVDSRAWDGQCAKDGPPHRAGEACSPSPCKARPRPAGELPQAFAPAPPRAVWQLLSSVVQQPLPAQLRLRQLRRAPCAESAALPRCSPLKPSWQTLPEESDARC